MLKTKTQTVISVLFVCGMGILSGCSIQDETNENIKNKTENEEITQISDLEQTFIDDANLLLIAIKKVIGIKTILSPILFRKKMLTTLLKNARKKRCG